MLGNELRETKGKRKTTKGRNVKCQTEVVLHKKLDQAEMSPLCPACAVLLWTTAQMWAPQAHAHDFSANDCCTGVGLSSTKGR